MNPYFVMNHRCVLESVHHIYPGDAFKKHYVTARQSINESSKTSGTPIRTSKTSRATTESATVLATNPSTSQQIQILEAIKRLKALALPIPR